MEEHSSKDHLLNLSNSSQISDPLTDINLKLISSIYPSRVDNSFVQSSTKEIALHDDSMRLYQLYSSMERKWYRRAFSAITPGSLRGSTFTLMSTALGAGMLSLPYMLRNCGLVLGVLFIILNGLCCLWSLYLLTKTAFRSDSTQYSAAVGKALGQRWVVIFSIVLIFYCWGTLVSYFITINQFISSFLQAIGVLSADEAYAWSHPGDQYYHTYIIIAIVAVLAYPIACFKNLSAFRYLTIFGVGMVTYIIILVVLQAPTQIANREQKYPDQEILYYKFDWQTIVGWSICTYSFTCHANVFPVRSELQRAMDERMRKIANRVVGSLAVLYLSIAIAGYLSLLDHTPTIFINRVEAVGWKDLFMTIAKAGMTINIFFAIPLNLSPCRLQILILFGKDKNPSDKLHYSLTLVLLVMSAGVAMLIPNIVTAIGVLGGICSTSLCFTFPTFLYLRYTRLKERHYKRFLVYIIGTVTTILGYSSAVITVLQLAGVLPKPPS